MIAAIMCGGGGSRMNANSEKSLLKVGGRTMIERVVSALASSGRFNSIIAAASPQSPCTAKFLKSKILAEVIQTGGKGYSRDIASLLARLKPEQVFVIPSDLPLLDSKIVSSIVLLAHGKQAQAVSIIMQKSFVEKLGVNPSVELELDGEQYCHSGITIFDTSKISNFSGIVEEQFIVMNEAEIAVNVNTKEELELAEKLLVQRAQNLA